jgi:hypothetical protein
MKSKQLANVLIKMLGLSVCLYAVPSIISGILFSVAHLSKDFPALSDFIPLVSYGIGAAVQAVVGLILIAKSQKIAGWMFRDEE